MSAGQEPWQSRYEAEVIDGNRVVHLPLGATDWPSPGTWVHWHYRVDGRRPTFDVLLQAGASFVTAALAAIVVGDLFRADVREGVRA